MFLQCKGSTCEGSTMCLQDFGFQQLMQKVMATFVTLNNDYDKNCNVYY